MSFFGDAMKMFTGSFTPSTGKPGDPASVPASPAMPGSADFDELKRQMAEMQARLEALAKK